jgi:hypothetical protein
MNIVYRACERRFTCLQLGRRVARRHVRMPQARDDTAVSAEGWAVGGKIVASLAQHRHTLQQNLCQSAVDSQKSVLGLHELPYAVCGEARSAQALLSSAATNMRCQQQPANNAAKNRSIMTASCT